MGSCARLREVPYGKLHAAKRLRGLDRKFSTMMQLVCSKAADCAFANVDVADFKPSFGRVALQIEENRGSKAQSFVDDCIEEV